MLFYVCNIIINYNSKCTHPSYGARLMLCWTDFGFHWHQDQRGYKKISYTENAFPSPTLLLSRLVLYTCIYFFQFVSQIHEKIWWNKILTKIYEILNQIMQLLHFILFFIYHSFQCMYIRLKCFCNLNFSDSEDIHVIIGWSRRFLNSSGVGFWRQIVFLN